MYVLGKPQIIIFDGVDKTGKSTLKKHFDKATTHLHWTIDRGPLSHMVYNYVYKRDIQNKHIDEITNVCATAHLVYCYADIDTIQKRINESVDEPVIDVKHDTRVFKCMLSATMHMYKSVLMLDTSKLTIKKCISKILENTACLMY